MKQFSQIIRLGLWSLFFADVFGRARAPGARSRPAAARRDEDANLRMDRAGSLGVPSRPKPGRFQCLVPPLGNMVNVLTNTMGLGAPLISTSETGHPNGATSLGDILLWCFSGVRFEEQGDEDNGHKCLLLH